MVFSVPTISTRALSGALVLPTFGQAQRGVIISRRFLGLVLGTHIMRHAILPLEVTVRISGLCQLHCVDELHLGRS